MIDNLMLAIQRSFGLGGALSVIFLSGLVSGLLLVIMASHGDDGDL